MNELTEQLRFVIETGTAAAFGNAVADGFVEGLKKSSPLSLRDLFAVHVVAAMVTRTSLADVTSSTALLARDAYRIADVLLATRDLPPDMLAPKQPSR